MSVERKKLTMRAAHIFAVLAFLARCSTGEMRDVDLTNPDSTSCNTDMDGSTGVGSTAFESLTVARAPTASGLSFNFYDKSCPNFKSIIQRSIAQALQANPQQAAGLTRVMFHDCFVQGCDASVLLTGANSEQSSTPNQSLRPESLQLINQIKSQLEQTCPHTVSCADIVSIAATEAIGQVQGPKMQIPLGRRDSAAPSSTVNLPSPFNNVSENLPIFSSLGFDSSEFVALSGAHTLGRSHCAAFSNRLHPLDVNLDVSLGKSLSQLCSQNSNNVHALDDTPTVFDTNFYKQILTGDVLLASDASLELDGQTVNLVKQYARSSDSFTAKFGPAFIKMSQLNVLTGSAGIIRRTCTASN